MSDDRPDFLDSCGLLLVVLVVLVFLAGAGFALLLRMVLT